MNLQKVLEYETTVHNFLKENSINIDVDKNIITYNGYTEKILNKYNSNLKQKIYMDYQINRFLFI